MSAPALGIADSFAILASSTVTNTGFSIITGDLGLSPGSSVTGFPPGTVIGTVHVADATASQAKSDTQIAYNALTAQIPTANLTGQDLGGLTLLAGVYKFDSSAQLTGILTLDGGGNPASVFIFQIGSTLTTASASSIVLTGEAQACNIFFQVGSSAILGTGTNFIGTVIANISITANTGASVAGRLLALTGAVTLDTNNITQLDCDAVILVVTVEPSVGSGDILCGEEITLSASGLPSGNVGTLEFRNPVDNSLICSNINPINTGNSLSCTVNGPLISGVQNVVATFIVDGNVIGVGTGIYTVLPGPNCLSAPVDLEVNTNPRMVICGDEVVVTATGFPSGNNAGVLEFSTTDGDVICSNSNPINDGTDSLSCTITSPLTLGDQNLTAIFRVGGVIAGVGTGTYTILPGTACTGGDPHIVCLDGSRLEVYEPGFYRVFDNLQELSQTPVIINAQVVRNRNQEDLYRRVYIKLVNVEYLLEFETQGIRCRSRRNGIRFNHQTSQEWSQVYTSETGEEYKFTCELAQNTIALQVGQKGEIRKYNGLLSGKLLRLPRLQDIQDYNIRQPELHLYLYRGNALLCGSAQPHVITLDKGRLDVKNGVFRLLQSPNICLNVRLDETGLLREAILESEETMVHWIWSGNHWSLRCVQDGLVMGIDNYYEKVFDTIMIRVQSNGSISCAIQSEEVVLRGLMVGEIIVLNDIMDITRVAGLKIVKEVVRSRVVGQSTSIYSRLIETV